MTQHIPTTPAKPQEARTDWMLSAYLVLTMVPGVLLVVAWAARGL
jgi:hypothetical protein